MSVGKSIRKQKLKDAASQTAIIVPIDHGYTMGPIDGLHQVKQVAKWIHHPAVNGIIAHKGIVERLAHHGLIGNKAVIMHVNGMPLLAKNADNKELVTSVDTAASYGVDGVSLQINFTGDNDSANWRQLGQVVDRAIKHGLPVLTMLYDKYQARSEQEAIDRFCHLTRSAIEMGTDSIKIAMPSSEMELRRYIEDVSEDVDIYVAGGALTSDTEILSQIKVAISAGAAGICVGRNIFARPNVQSFLTQLAFVVRRYERIAGLVKSEAASEVH